VQFEENEIPDDSVFIEGKFGFDSIKHLSALGFDPTKKTLIFGGFVDFYIDWNALAYLMQSLDQCRCVFHTHYYDVTTTMNDFHNLEEETNTIITHEAA